MGKRQLDTVGGAAEQEFCPSAPASIGRCSHGPSHGKRTSAPLPSPVLAPFLAVLKID